MTNSPNNDAASPGSPYGQNGSLSVTGNNGNSGQSASPAAPATSVVIGIGPQTFRVTCTGLKPNTLHKAYLVSEDVSINCAPIVDGSTTSASYIFGADLITDITGYLQFDYAFTPQNSPYTTQFIASTNQTIAIIPAGNQDFKVLSTDGNSHAESFIISKGTLSA